MDLQYKILHKLEVDMYHSTAWGLCKIWRTVYVSKSTLNVLQLRLKFIYVYMNINGQWTFSIHHAMAEKVTLMP